ncbi:hypothetical protein HNV11_19840 [Spirosoma taeanense]|uniref:HMA domain-containing protein n=1 Tax=Spirosoma taeanense TaxID=2735870 RepID=A0A6M5YDT4_9BACT|nr:hypothetical protein [Spirosoma taeanense]QJW91470.1 hypothetical protein HNV11_19840 [Spirosoma taeanense]
MKPFLSLFFFLVGFAALAQKSTHSSLNTSINEDGKTMSIRAEGQRNGRVINYDRTFDVTRLSNAERDALKKRVLDSLGIGDAPDWAESRISIGPEDDRRSSGALGGTMVTPEPPTPPSFVDPSVPDGQELVTFQCATCAGRIRLTLTSASASYSFVWDTRRDKDKRFFPYQLALPFGNYQLKYYQNGVLQIQSGFTVKSGNENQVVIK